MHGDDQRRRDDRNDGRRDGRRMSLLAVRARAPLACILNAYKVDYTTHLSDAIEFHEIQWRSG